jgi:hypothetical protein
MAGTVPSRLSMRQRIFSVVGAHPDFMKTAPVMAETARRPAESEQLLIETGQHDDFEMCVFRSKPNTDSAASRTLIPEQAEPIPPANASG